MAKNIAESIRTRLLNKAESEKLKFERIATKWVLERVLARLEVSRYNEIYVLKGGMLPAVWLEEGARSTRDIDFLSREKIEEDRIREIFIEIFNTKPPDEDGLIFLEESIKTKTIKEADAYPGINIRAVAILAKMRIPVVIDIGYGDTIYPHAASMVYPVIIDGYNEPKILAYTRESLIAEKFQAIASLGLTNSRLKDFYDIARLLQTDKVDDKNLTLAIESTFKRRKTQIPLNTPDMLDDEYARSDSANKKWNSYIKKEKLQFEFDGGFPLVCKIIRNRLMPLCQKVYFRENQAT